MENISVCVRVNLLSYLIQLIGFLILPMWLFTEMMQEESGNDVFFVGGGTVYEAIHPGWEKREES